MSITPGILGIFMLFGGIYINYNDIVVWLRWISWLSVFRWGYQAAAIVL
jgi:hypothetical protein